MKRFSASTRRFGGSPRCLTQGFLLQHLLWLSVPGSWQLELELELGVVGVRLAELFGWLGWVELFGVGMAWGFANWADEERTWASGMKRNDCCWASWTNRSGMGDPSGVNNISSTCVFFWGDFLMDVFGGCSSFQNERLCKGLVWEAWYLNGFWWIRFWWESLHHKRSLYTASVWVFVLWGTSLPQI